MKADTDEIRHAVLVSGTDCASSVGEVLELVHNVSLSYSLLHTSDVSTSAIAIASARTFTLEHKRRKQGGLYLELTIALTFCRFTLEDF